MIKAEIEVKGCTMFVNGYEFSVLKIYDTGIRIYKNGTLHKAETTVEKAIQYCLNN